MKKIFTLAAAVLASVAMMAADFVPTAVYRVGDATTLGAQWKDLKQIANYFEVADTVVFSPFVLYQSAASGWQEWTGSTGAGSSGTTWNAIEGRCFQGSSAMFTSDSKIATVRESRIYMYNVTNCSQVMALVKSSSSITMTMSAYEIVAGEVSETAAASATYKSGSIGVLSLEDLDNTKTYRIQLLTDNSGSNSSLYEIAFVGPQSTDPMLNVNPAEVTLAVTAAVPQDEATVKFTGKNLAAGSYNLTIPNLAGLTVNPTSVTVGEDGKLNQEVTIAYTSAVDVEAASTSISLTIGELSKSVAINYSASLAKVYATSLNIEQLVLDNGKSANITAALEAANLDFANIDALDTLNDDASKTARNYAFLGLKMRKNVESKMALWLAQGSTLKIRFGNVPANVTVTINGEASTITKENIANIDVTDANVYSYTATEEAYIAFTCNTSKALVYKQIMINEEIAEVVLPAPTPTAISNTNANVKAVKVVRNGQLFIEKNGVVYNAQGAIVK